MTMTENVTVDLRGIVSDAMYVLASDRFFRSVGSGWGSDTSDAAPPPDVAPVRPITRMQRTVVSLRLGNSTSMGDWPAQPQPAPMPSIVQTGPCRCPVCVGRSVPMPTCAIDPAGFRAFLVAHASTLFNVMKGSVCAVAQYLNVEHGTNLVVYMREAKVDERLYLLPPWTALLISRLTDRTRPYRSGAEVAAVLDEVLRDLGMPPVVPPPAEGATAHEVADTVIIAPAARARRSVVSALDGMVRDHQVADRRPQIAHRVE